MPQIAELTHKAWQLRPIRHIPELKSNQPSILTGQIFDWNHHGYV